MEKHSIQEKSVVSTSSKRETEADPEEDYDAYSDDFEEVISILLIVHSMKAILKTMMSRNKNP